MQPKRARHHVRDHDVALDLVDEQEERGDPEHAHRIDEQGVDHRRDGREPGADVRDHLDERRPEAEEQRVLVGALDEAGLAEDPHPDPRARPDHRREDRLPLDVPPERGLDLLRERWPTVRREARVDRAFQPWHVQEHVDRDDDDQDRREEQQHDRDRRALGELDPFLRVAGDVPGAERVDPFVHLLAHLNALEPVVVEPRLEPVDVPLRLGLAGSGVLVRDVIVDPLRCVARLVERDGADGDQTARRPWRRRSRRRSSPRAPAEP